MQSTAVNQGASIKNLETQIGQLTKLITNFSKDYAGNTVDNPTKEVCKAIGKRGEKTEDKRKKDEEELKQFQKWFKQLGMTLEEAYNEFMDELEEYYEETQAEMKKENFPLSNETLEHLLFPSVLESYEKEIVLVDQSVLRLSGVMKDVLVKVKNLLFPVDFIIVDIEEDADIPIILGRPFLATSRAVIDMEKEVLKLRMGNEEQLIYIQGKNDWCCRIDAREPKNSGWKMKVTMEELEAGFANLELKKKPRPVIDITDVKNEYLWVRRWGRFCKVTVRSTPRVNEIKIKKPERCNIIRFKKVIDYSKQPAEVKWINIPRKPKVEEVSEKKSCVKGDIPGKHDICYAFYKEEQMADEKTLALIKARRETRRTYPQ
ncbi:hypothetical protein A2U01_0007480 [Trifolium medium]|uniref:Uncharacterized protein n=1 Tax=Trifolium medium TaxID=97028 RepID=A0A392MH32_9FABA|nr:hypothetical protein [Trifolium medium]